MHNRILFLVLSIATALCANLAAAHGILVSSSPAKGSILAEPPREIRLSFNESVEARFSAVTLVRNDGKLVVSGRPSSDGQKRSDIVVALPALQPGKYQVRWQTTSADSHRIQGSFGFEIKP
jgi:methionine-rich copper-binding protein CopC